MDPCTGKSRRKIIPFVAHFILSFVHLVKAFLHHTVHLSCHFPNSQKIDVNNLVIFWQKDTIKVVHEVYYGQEKHENLSPEYINRTKVDTGKWTLQLLNAGVEDEGLYQCIIMQKITERSTEVIHKSESNYSQPEIAELHSGELKPNGYLNLSCSSGGGYPEPKEMTWLISYENITHSSTAHMDISQDAVTKLYNVTSKLNIPVPEKSHTNISCLLHLREQLGSLVSVPLAIGESPFSPMDHIWLTNCQIDCAEFKCKDHETWTNIRSIPGGFHNIW
uniref:Ig-like domain-containing protein n=1 Tax=Catharus ustulatus TaxID=91951 RepID=A0A8C3U1N3_CATUS